MLVQSIKGRLDQCLDQALLARQRVATRAIDRRSGQRGTCDVGGAVLHLHVELDGHAFVIAVTVAVDQGAQIEVDHRTAAAIGADADALAIPHTARRVARQVTGDWLGLVTTLVADHIQHACGNQVGHIGADTVVREEDNPCGAIIEKAQPLVQGDLQVVITRAALGQQTRDAIADDLTHSDRFVVRI